MKSIFVLYIAVLVGILSCTRENPLYDNSVNSWNLLIVTGESNTKISKTQQPDGNILIDNLLANAEIKSEIKQIVAYGVYLYILIPKDFKILVLDKFSYNIVNSIDFSDHHNEPSAIAFANNTDAYVIHTNANKVSLIDTKFFKIVRTYDVGIAPIDIAYTNNLIIVANSKSNTLSLIDSRNYTKLPDISVKDVPMFIAVAPTSGKLAIVCSGNGKDDTISDNNSTAYFQVFDPNSKQITYTAELKTSLIDGTDIYPNALAVTNKDLAFISTQYGLFSINTNSPTLLNLAKKEAYAGVYYNYPKEELILIQHNNTAFAAKQTNGNFLYELTMPQSFSSLLAY